MSSRGAARGPRRGSGSAPRAVPGPLPSPPRPRAVPPGAVCRPPRRCARCAPGPARCRRGGRWGRGGAAGNGNKGAAGGGAWQGAAALTARPDPTRRDAEDAVYGRDGYDYDGYRLRVEFPRSGRGTGRGGGGGGGGGAPRGRYGPPSRRSEYRVIVSGESRLSPPGPSGCCARGAMRRRFFLRGVAGLGRGAGCHTLCLGRSARLPNGPPVPRDDARPPNAVLPAGEARAIGF